MLEPPVRGEKHREGRAPSAEAFVRDWVTLDLDEESQTSALLAALRRSSKSEPGTGQESALPQECSPGTIVEILLLLRLLAGPQRAALAQGEVHRRGLETWK
jgi:hypothetical protein